MSVTRREHEDGWVPLGFPRHEEKWRDFDHPSQPQRAAFDDFKVALLTDPYSIVANPLSENVVETEPRWGLPFLAVVPGSLDDATVTVCTYTIADSSRAVACLGLDNVVIDALVDPPDD